jgi:phenylalanyl-tRNA synthetase beta chain
VGLGLNEVITYSLTDKDLWRDFRIYQGPEAIEILNPLSKEQEILRPRLMPSLAACVAYNLNQKQDYINIFEVSQVFSQSKASTQEELSLGIALCGIKSLLLTEGLIKDPVGLLHLKGILEALFAQLGVRDYDFNTQDNVSAIAVYVAKEKIGLMTKLEKSVLDKLDIKNKDVFVLELSLDRLLFFINLNKNFVHLPIYPGISRDISLILKDEISVGDILKAIKGEGKPLLKQAAVLDYYKGKQIPSGFKGLTISCLYRSDERTLTEAEINPAHSLICKILAERFGSRIR